MTNNKNSNGMKKKSFRDNIIIYFFFQTFNPFKSPRPQIFLNYYLGTFHLYFKNFLNMY